jgi:S-methylmethionine-dependent homocysteine/selenocysteine methylase
MYHHIFSYIDAGADILLTNTYQANIKRMEKEVGIEEATKLVTVSHISELPNLIY